MPDLYAVVGHPVSHSLSPFIHAAFAEQLQHSLCYERIEAPLDDFKGTIRRLVVTGYCGVNVTVPFKTEAWDLSTQRTARAALAGAVNTLSFFEDGQILGDNTDGVGLVADLNHLGLGVCGRRLLVLGAGGAVRGVLGPLLAQKPASLVVCNRTEARARALASLFPDIDVMTYESLAGESFDGIINGTSVGLSDQNIALPAALLAPGAFAYDMVYGRQTMFMQWAHEQGIEHVVDGLGMLVEQAAEAFLVWRGIRPETMAVRAQLRLR